MKVRRKFEHGMCTTRTQLWHIIIYTLTPPPSYLPTFLPSYQDPDDPPPLLLLLQPEDDDDDEFRRLLRITFDQDVLDDVDGAGSVHAELAVYQSEGGLESTLPLTTWVNEPPSCSILAATSMGEGEASILVVVVAVVVVFVSPCWAAVVSVVVVVVVVRCSCCSCWTFCSPTLYVWSVASKIPSRYACLSRRCTSCLVQKYSIAVKFWNSMNRNMLLRPPWWWCLLWNLARRYM